MLRTKLTFDMKFALIIAGLKWTKMNFDANLLLRFDHILCFIELKWNNLLMFSGNRTWIRNNIPFMNTDR